MMPFIDILPCWKVRARRYRDTNVLLIKGFRAGSLQRLDSIRTRRHGSRALQPLEQTRSERRRFCLPITTLKQGELAKLTLSWCEIARWERYNHCSVKQGVGLVLLIVLIFALSGRL